MDDPTLLGPGRNCFSSTKSTAFNKAQQDFPLPLVETGRVTLIGATTENPSFEIISALLSRCRVFVLNSLSDKEIRKIIERTKIKVPKDALDWLVSLSNGDARIAITAIENTKQVYGNITTQTLKSAFEHPSSVSTRKATNTMTPFRRL